MGLHDVTRKVREGDKVLGVNGVTENIDEMRDELNKDAIRMFVQSGNVANPLALRAQPPPY